MTAPLTRPLAVLPPAPSRRVLGEATRFLLVGGAATFVDVGSFNLLHYAVTIGGAGIGPLTSKVLATVLGGAAAFVGNRQWSFSGASDGRWQRQAVAFLLVNLASLLLALLPLAVARYVLGMTGVVALNVAGNGIGLLLATGLRFWGYRRWVFPTPVPERARDDADDYEGLAA